MFAYACFVFVVLHCSFFGVPWPEKKAEPRAALGRASVADFDLEMSISQFYILSARGDTIINKDYRGDIPQSTAETFFRKMKSGNEKERKLDADRSGRAGYL